MLNMTQSQNSLIMSNWKAFDYTVKVNTAKICNMTFSNEGCSQLSLPSLDMEALSSALL